MSNADNETLTCQITKLEVELDMANKSLDDRNNQIRELTSDLNIVQREKRHLQNELERLEKRLSDMRGATDNQVLQLTLPPFSKCILTSRTMAMSLWPSCLWHVQCGDRFSAVWFYIFIVCYYAFNTWNLAVFAVMYIGIT